MQLELMFKAIEEDFKEKSSQWLEIDEDAYNWYLNHLSGTTDDEHSFIYFRTGKNVYLVCKRHSDKFYSKYIIVREPVIIPTREATLDMIKEDFKANNPQWREIDKEAYDWFLECLPPIRQNNGYFVNSEPCTHCPRTYEDVYLGCKEESGRFYARYLTLRQYDRREF